MAAYIGEFSRQHLLAQAGAMCQFPLAEIPQYEAAKLLDSGMTGIVAKVAAVCNFHGIQQGGAVGYDFSLGERDIISYKSKPEQMLGGEQVSKKFGQGGAALFSPSGRRLSWCRFS